MFYLVLSLNRQPLSTNRLQNVENSLFSEHIQFCEYLCLYRKYTYNQHKCKNRFLIMIVEDH